DRFGRGVLYLRRRQRERRQRLTRYSPLSRGEWQAAIRPHTHASVAGEFQRRTGWRRSTRGTCRTRWARAGGDTPEKTKVVFEIRREIFCYLFRSTMTVQRMKWLLPGVLGIVLLTWTTFAIQQQVKKIDDKALKDAGKSTDWLSRGMDWGEQRYSTMTQINPQNIGKLALAWSYELGSGGGNQQANPLYSNGVLYTVTNWSIVAAVDAKTGKEIWRYDPEADRTMTQPGKSRLCCGVNSRGLALYEGKLLVPVIDGRMQALDAATGKLLWSTWAIPEPKAGEISSYSITIAARAAKGKVFI